MFGRNNDDQSGQAMGPDPSLSAPAVDPADVSSGGSTVPSAVQPNFDTTETPDPLAQPPALSLPSAQSVAADAAQSLATADGIAASSTPALGSLGDDDTPVPANAPASAPALSSSPAAAPAPAAVGPAAPASSEELLAMKQQALQNLQPLISQLEQTPEEEFRTLMMMIQASDDQSMLGKAYEAAQKITDDKVRAQALLDVINEINYFTQQHQG